MTTVIGSDIDQGQENLWHAGGEYKTNVEKTETAGVITLGLTAEYGSVVAYDKDTGVEMADCTELQTDDSAATQDSGTQKVQTSAAGTADVLLNFIDITSALEEVFACKTVSIKMAADEYSEPVQGQPDQVTATGSAKWDMSVSQMKANNKFVALAYGVRKTDVPKTGWSKQHSTKVGVNKIGVMVGKRYVSGVLKAKYFCLGCEVKSLTKDIPASGFSADSFDFSIDSAMEINED